jgi:predicted kinase
LIIASRGTYDSSTFTSDTISQYQSEAETTLISQLTTLLKQAEHDIVLDLSFYSNEWRNETRAMIEKEGRGRHEVLLVVFRGEEEFIWRRIESRNVLFESKLEERRELEGVVVSREMLRAWKEGFEWPDGEGEIIVWIG